MTRKIKWIEEIARYCHVRDGARWRAVAIYLEKAVFIPKGTRMSGILVAVHHNFVDIQLHGNAIIIRCAKRDLIFDEKI